MLCGSTTFFNHLIHSLSAIFLLSGLYGTYGYNPYARWKFELQWPYRFNFKGTLFSSEYLGLFLHMLPWNGLMFHGTLKKLYGLLCSIDVEVEKWVGGADLIAGKFLVHVHVELGQTHK